jgi:hypothetical protein
MLQLAGKLPPQYDFSRIRNEIFGIVANAYGAAGKN